MYVESVLGHWWELQQKKKWREPAPFLSERMLVVADNASVHKARELKEPELMEKYGILLRLLSHNMTKCLQPVVLQNLCNGAVE
jgi:hypothetical protein